MAEFKTYTIEQKIDYFRKRLDDPNITEEQRRYAVYKLQDLEKGIDTNGYQMREKYGFKKTGER